MAGAGGGNDTQWYFSQVKGAIDDVVAEADIISAVEFYHSGELLATGDKGGREQENKIQSHSKGEYNVYSTFQRHEPEFDYLKCSEIEEKINKIIKKDKNQDRYNLKKEDKRYRDITIVTILRVPVFRPMDLMVEASPQRIFANSHTHHSHSISINSITKPIYLQMICGLTFGIWKLQAGFLILWILSLPIWKS
ncbi:hypothetical protein HPG69_018480 [Diceros bicornis minor]|uniref:Uncharacterized protein n=1 Tax=Diceros bicornis minor TaxID=77932 RepID=A0A7J7EQU2_DICBM|nr:hypothetical protein HPG69_018480 [Diceros bicornis minor]